MKKSENTIGCRNNRKFYNLVMFNSVDGVYDQGNAGTGPKKLSEIGLYCNGPWVLRWIAAVSGPNNSSSFNRFATLIIMAMKKNR